MYLQTLPSHSRVVQHIIIAPILSICGPVWLPGVPVLLAQLVTTNQPIPPALKAEVSCLVTSKFGIWDLIFGGNCAGLVLLRTVHGGIWHVASDLVSQAQEQQEPPGSPGQPLGMRLGFPVCVGSSCETCLD